MGIIMKQLASCNSECSREIQTHTVVIIAIWYFKNEHILMAQSEAEGTLPMNSTHSYPAKNCKSMKCTICDICFEMRYIDRYDMVIQLMPNIFIVNRWISSPEYRNKMENKHLHSSIHEKPLTQPKTDNEITILI